MMAMIVLAWFFWRRRCAERTLMGLAPRP
jgi:hypothetical protein